MPQCEPILIPLTRNIGRQNQLHFLVHFNDYSPDMGRKGFHRELTDFAKSAARFITENHLSKLRHLLKANTGMGYTYQWALNNAAISGATKKQYTATAVGNYKVAVTNADACSKTSQKVTVVTSCKETTMDISSVQLTAFPNPFSGTTRIDLSVLNGIEGQLEVRITDISGKILFSKTFSHPEEIETGNELPAGFYLVEIKGNGFHQVLPVIKQ